MRTACSVRVRGLVQGVGFRPFVFRLARTHTLAGWVLNDDDGVEIHVEGPDAALQTFLRDLHEQSPPAAKIATIDVSRHEPADLTGFTIRASPRRTRPTARISPDLAVCNDCLRELFDPRDRRFRYPYINCTNCGPRYTVIRDVPYDRHNTTMRPWTLDPACAAEYHDPGDRRFHAQPVACADCGPHYRLVAGPETVEGTPESLTRAATLLTAGSIVAVKGLGGYHLACDARNAQSVAALRERKYRKEQAFALMARDVGVARSLVELSEAALALLESVARPIVVAPARVAMSGVAPDGDAFGVMLPYSPLHHLLFAAGAPDVLVMTSANRSSEPIAYEDADALVRLEGLADAFLVGERPIARRVDDSVVRADASGSVVLRRARGYAPGVVAMIPTERPVLAVGGDLKNAITLVVDGQAIVSQHIGDLDQEPCRRAFRETVDDLLRMYDVGPESLLIVHDAHPEYASTREALERPAMHARAVQHHRAHIASVLAERQAWDTPVLGVAFDGTGYGDDGTIWGGELLAGSVRCGFVRVGHLRPASLPGGDAAARHPVQAAAGLLAHIDGLPDLCAPPFDFPTRFRDACEVRRRGVRTFVTTSMGRLFDTVAALLGFTRPVTYEGQAAMWLEQRARLGRAGDAGPYEMPFEAGELDFRPMLAAVIRDRVRCHAADRIARAVHECVARATVGAVAGLCATRGLDTVVLSGGVFQNRLLSADVKSGMARRGLQVWTNLHVPPNDGGISLGQAAIGALCTENGRA